MLTCGSNADISIFGTLFSWKGTVLPMVIFTPLFWLMVALHGFFLILDNRGLLDAEITTKLWEEADDLRQKAEKNETLMSMEEVSRMLGFTEETLSETKALISRLAADADV